MPPDARAWIDVLKWSGHSGCHTRLDEKVFRYLLTGHIRSKPHAAGLSTTSPRTVFLLTQRCSRAGFCYRRSLNGMCFRNSILVWVPLVTLCCCQCLAIALLSSQIPFFNRLQNGGESQFDCRLFVKRFR